MGHNSEKLWKPINWLADLQPFFGIVGGLAYITHTITARSDFNPWSQNKPFRSNAVAFADDNARQAALCSITHGFTIPQLGSDAYFKAHYKDKWVYNSVTSAYPSRPLDYDGYVNNTVRNREWGEEGAMGSWINTIFGGVLSLKRSTAEVYDNDTFNFDLFDATPPLVGRSGLLYPIDFYGASGLDLREYFIGIAFVTASAAYIITGADKIKNANEEVTLDGVPLPGTGQIPVNSSFDIVPILCSKSVTSLTDLRSVSDFNIVTLNGVYKTLTRKPTSQSVTFVKGNPYIENGHAMVDLQIKNNTSTTATLYSMSLYIVSEHTFDYGPISDVESQIKQWISAGTLHTGGVYVDGTRYARFASLGTQTVLGNSGVLNLTFDFGANTSTDDLGYDYDQWSVSYLCYQLNGQRIMTT